VSEADPSCVPAGALPAVPSMEEYFAVVSHALSPVLVREAARERIRHLAARLPPQAMGGLECRLGDDDRVDFHLFLRAGDSEVPPNVARHPWWSRLLELAARDASRDEDVVIEFDLDGRPGEDPRTSLFVPLEGTCGTDFGWLESADRDPPVRGLEPLEENLKECLVCVVPGVFIAHIGAMLTRPDPCVRLNVGGIHVRALGAYLKAAPWKGDPNAAQAALEALAPSTRGLRLALDVGPAGVATRIGIECFPPVGSLQARPWRPLVDLLVRMGLCLREKADALDRWPGYDRRASSERWPPDLAIMERLLGPDAVSFFVRRLSHVKVAFETTIGDAKAYLAFSHLWLHRRTFEGGSG
jgi:hypothetical protein